MVQAPAPRDRLRPLPDNRLRQNGARGDPRGRKCANDRSGRAAMTSGGKLLEVQELRKTYAHGRRYRQRGRPQDETVAIKRISFDIESGETLPGVGQAGSGKST